MRKVVDGEGILMHYTGWGWGRPGEKGVVGRGGWVSGRSEPRPGPGRFEEYVVVRVPCSHQYVYS